MRLLAQRTQTINQARALIITGPDDIRTRFTGQTPAELVAELAALRPRPGSMVRYHTLLALRELGRRGQFRQALVYRGSGSRLTIGSCHELMNMKRLPNSINTMAVSSSP